MKTLHCTTDNKGRLEAGKLVIAFMVFFILILLVAETSAQVVNGNSGHCRSFDGSTTNVTFTNNDLGLSSGNTMTVTAWVKCNSTVNEGGWANLVTLNNSTSNGDDGQFWLQHSSDNTLFEFAVENKSSNRTYVQSVTAPVNGVWYHVAGVYDGSFIYLYVNGVMETKTAQTGNINNFQGNYNLDFGQWAYNGNAYRRFNGDIDEVTIWNTALTQTQIRTNMCQSIKGTEAGLIGYWRMNETSGNSVYDKTSNNRTGTAANTKIVWSGAPIGNASSFTYGGTRLGLSNPTYNDSLVVNSFSTTPTGIFIYRIDTTANYTTAPAGYSSLATNYYYGVFIVGSTIPTYTMTYYYTGNPYASSPSLIGMVSRFDDSASTWTNVSAALSLVTKTFQKTGQSGRNEYDLGLTKKVLPIELASFNAAQATNNVE
ncbi:MAG TPA: LamG domain-containing protein, partial [Bacteroidia bacterium]|nr:LamG domain-containing protein [Bacteroidia bacterium]